MIRKLFNNRIFIVCLAVCSALLMLRSVATPFLDEPDFSDVVAPAFDPEEAAPAELEIVAASEPTTAGSEEIWRAELSVLSGQMTWNSEPRRDPFSGSSAPVVPVLPSASAPGVQVAVGIPRLDALVAGPDSLLAVLNDQVVREGDLIAGYEVTRIAPDGVRISSRHQSHWLAVADMVVERATERTTDDEALAGTAEQRPGRTDAGAPGA